MTGTGKSGQAGKPRAAGFSLVEVLIALIVMSVGMLGIAGLYVHSMQAGRTSLFRHHAVNLAGDVADRIRANPSAGAAYAGAGSDAGNCVGGGSNCAPEQMAAYDIHLWDIQADTTLPEGSVEVTYTAGTPANYQVTIRWQEAGLEADPPSYTIAFPIFEMEM